MGRVSGQTRHPPFSFRGGRQTCGESARRIGLADLIRRFAREMARSAGFEPTTPAFGGQYSNQLSYERVTEVFRERDSVGRPVPLEQRGHI